MGVMLQTLTVLDVASPANTVPAHLGMREARALLRRDLLGEAFVVDEGGRPLGVVSLESLDGTESALDDPQQALDFDGIDGVPLIAATRPSVVTVAPETPVSQAIELLRRRGLKRLLITGGSRILGQVSESDILRGVCGIGSERTLYGAAE